MSPIHPYTRFHPPTNYFQSATSTCDKADGGAVAAAEGRIAPRDHGNTKVVVPGRQQVGDSLVGTRLH